MAKLDYKEIYQERLNQVNEDLQSQYRRGKNKNKARVVELLREKERLKEAIGI